MARENKHYSNITPGCPKRRGSSKHTSTHICLANSRYLPSHHEGSAKSKTKSTHTSPEKSWVSTALWSNQHRPSFSFERERWHFFKKSPPKTSLPYYVLMTGIIGNVSFQMTKEQKKGEGERLGALRFFIFALLNHPPPLPRPSNLSSPASPDKVRSNWVTVYAVSFLPICYNKDVGGGVSSQWPAWLEHFEIMNGGGRTRSPFGVTAREAPWMRVIDAVTAPSVGRWERLAVVTKDTVPGEEQCAG